MDRRDFLKGGLGVVATTALEASGTKGNSADRFLLIARDRPLPQIVVGTEDGYAGRHLAEALYNLTARQATVIGAQDSLPDTGGPIILVGSANSNPKLASLLEQEHVTGKLGSQGFFLKTASGVPPTLLLAGGGRVGAIYAVNELLNFYVESSGNEAWISRSLSVIENPALPYRIFWTWDHSTNWKLGVHGLQENGCANPYMKAPEVFLEDYKRVIDFMSSHKINGLVIWGFLRDAHGGVRSSQELAQYADERGVHILPGVGSEYYGGFYYEGDHKFNVNTWLARNPDSLRLLDTHGKRLPDAICPSKLSNQGWLRDGAHWLFSTIPGLGGVNLENGDFMTCQTEDCQGARGLAKNDPNYYWDMMKTQLAIIEEGSKINPNAWLTYATYTGFTEGEMWQYTPRDLIRGKLPRFVDEYPSTAICQWTYSRMVTKPGQRLPNRSLWPEGVKPPTKHSVGLLHQGSQWWKGSHWWCATSSGNDVGGRYDEILKIIQYTAQRAHQAGMEGIEIQGEVSPTSPQNELNYLAFEEFCWNPSRSMDEFIEKRLDRVYGSGVLARQYVNYVLSDESKPSELLRWYGEARELAADHSLRVDQRERWGNLSREIARRLSMVDVSKAPTA